MPRGVQQLVDHVTAAMEAGHDYGLADFKESLSQMRSDDHAHNDFQEILRVLMVRRPPRHRG